jgi:flagellar biosynthesis/type III secretory pathway chaperone
MSHPATRNKLHQLHDLLLQEREHAKSLEIDKMLAVSRQKQELIDALGPIKELDADDRVLAERIRHENRRNAYLFWSTLTWIRETMEFFGKKVSPCSYNAGGTTLNKARNGRLLSGKV